MEKELTGSVNGIAKPQRNKSIELLRIVLMLMIIASHVKAHGGIVYESFGINSAVLAIFKLGGNLATNVFILITGYYSLQSKFNYKKIIRLILEVTFYQIVLGVISLVCGRETFSVNYLLALLFPVFFGGGYWFIVRYLQLYLLIPMLNAGIKSISKKMHLALITIFGIMFSVFPALIGQFFSVQDYQFNTLVWFVWLYALGAYLSLYGSVLFEKKKLTVALLALSVAALLTSLIIKNYFSFRDLPSDFILKAIRKAAALFGNSSRNGVLIAVISLLLFTVFRNMSLKLPDRIVTVSGSVFGIYLLHENRACRNFLWQDILGTTRMQDSALFPLYAVGAVLLVFAVCFVIDFLVRKFIFKPLFKKFKL